MPNEKLVAEKNVFDSLWEQFAADRKENRAIAYTNLQQNLAKNASALVPDYMTAKEHLELVTKVEEWTKGDKQSDSGDPMTMMSDWLQGKVDLSRVPLTEKLQ